MTTRDEARAAIEAMTTWQLARAAEVADPDTADAYGFELTDEERAARPEPSAGAEFLRSAAWSALDIIGNADDYAGNPGDTLAERAEYEGRINEEADSCVPVYTHQLWLAFVDLCAYEEETDELAGPDTDMTKRAGIALYMIAERLIRELLDHLAPDDDEDDDEEDDDA